MTRHDIGRRAFLEEVWKWKDEKQSKIASDLRKLGTSFNWESEYFTMNPNLCDAVNEAFIRLFEKGLIYRDVSLINWSCALESAISDVEVDNLEIQGKTEIFVPNYDKNITFGIISDIAYKVVDSNEEIVVSTTRPETMLGDVAVAVHPDDDRYSHLKNAQLWHPFRKLETIPLIFDESVNPQFGTGAVKITPAHDKNDFDVGKRHKLRNIQVITEKGLISDEFAEFSEIPRFIARDKILNKLADLQLLRGTRPHNMVLPICSRSKDVIEFLLRPQWFVKCEEMSKRAVEVVEKGELKIHPSNFEKEWFRWLNNCRDWCISRQLWWGHQIPAYRVTTNEGSETWIAAKSLEEAKIKFREGNSPSTVLRIEQDPDVLDTWFSSGLLPFSVLGWPKSDGLMNKNFPLDLMETGHDILFFWVARMVMLSLELTNKVPFKEVLLHGIICDSYGRKMSKSLGNVLSPDHIIHGATLEQLHKETEESAAKGILSQSELAKSLEGQKVMFNFGIKECGIDAMRFTLCSHNIKNHFISFDVKDCHTNKNFFNKIYNATKYANGMAEAMNVVIKDINSLEGLKLADMDRWLLSRLGSTVKLVKTSMENYNFHLATSALKSFFYRDLCDVYVETTKLNRLKENPEAKVNAIVLNTCLAVGLEYLEVFSPFLANDLKAYVAKNCKMNPEDFMDNTIEQQVSDLLEICENIREMKVHCRITKKIPSEIQLLIKSPEHEKFLRSQISNIKKLTFTDDLIITTDSNKFESEDFIGLSTAGHLCSFGVRTLNKSSKKADNTLNVKKYVKMENELNTLLKTISNDGYQKNANEKVQQKHKTKIEKLKEELKSIREMC